MFSIRYLFRPVLFILILSVPAAQFAAESPQAGVYDTYPLTLAVLDARLLIGYTAQEGVELQRVIAGNSPEALSLRALGNFAIECSDRFNGQCKIFSTLHQ